MESEADAMMISTDKWRLTQQELASLRAANARLVVERNQISNAFKRMIFTALGEMPADWIDSAVSNLIARRPKKN